ncbi:hypothetical protein RM780_09980 [Streptomyces sp. DSM 44917]|uniref:Transcriptional regulator n=1 Tax=Streptomyces boetiae TaxID=3075541 RepID=A0ABU2L6V3_9ACTN|nr:hypothetical protein [Streptomyces sp. DSM 44917]MDT0307291.1 hypothetical protein [Streptomyces sp. DSM 44917]
MEDALIDRRGFMTVSGVAVTAAASGWACAEPDRLTASAHGGRLDEETVAWVEDRIPALRKLDDRLSGDSVLRLALADLHMVTELISHSSYSAALGQRLLRTAAELAYLAGWVAFDSGLHSAAQRHYLTALHAAHAADDRPLGANVLAGMAFQAALAGAPVEAVSLADTAEEHSGDTSPRVRAFLASRQARAHAVAGDERACARALNRAEQLLDTADTAAWQDPAWVYYFDSAELAAQAGACFVDLGQPEQAEPVLMRALADQAPSYVRDRTIYTIRLARARLQAGHLDHACDLAAQAAELAHSARSNRGSQEVSALRTSLQPFSSSPAVTALDERIAALAA